MKKLWDKGIKLNEAVEIYTSGENVKLDNKLVYYDAIGSIAHAYMLLKIGILTKKEFSGLQKVLVEIINLQKKGKFEVEYGEEDVHTKIENFLIEKIGEAGKKLHTGRSRNDQVQVDLRLFTKDEIYSIVESTLNFIEKSLDFAKKYEFLPVPGYTHMQKAMPSSVGTWAGSFVESCIDDLTLVKASYHINDQSPLGSGAAYGVSLPIKRTLTSKLLGFTKVQNNVLYAQVSRPKSHLALMQALCQIMLTLSRLAEDILLFTTSEFDFFTVPAELCTGSSIMPQKKNVDIMEILRSRAHVVLNNTNTVSTISSGLPSGYNSDFQETKKLFMDTIEITKSSLDICSLTLESLTPNEPALKKAMTPEIFSTHAAYELVKKGMSFREAYKKIGAMRPNYPLFDAKEVLSVTNHQGAPGNLGLSNIKNIISFEKNWWKKEKALFDQALQKLITLL